ncbi:hypothetical protein Are01nite_39570 [Actinoplanes regularis]|nr:hypothetical protein Are01nite_39570 [Actinoplanes regularis]
MNNRTGPPARSFPGVYRTFSDTPEPWHDVPGRGNPRHPGPRPGAALGPVRLEGSGPGPAEPSKLTA